MTLNSEALLPCPLCNCGMMLDRFIDWEGQPLANQVIIHPSPSECPLVDTQIDATPEAIAAWNRRSPSLSGGEVVAWRVRERPGFDWRFVDGDPGRDPRLNGYEKQPLYASPAPDIIAAKDAEIERVTRERDDFQSGYIKALDKIEAAEAHANAAVEALKAVWPFVAKHYSPHIESEFKLAEQVNNALRSFASLNGAKP